MGRASWISICAGRGWRDEMKPHLSIPQLTFIVSVAVVAGLLLVAIFYLFHKAVRKGLSEGKTAPPAPRATNQTAFLLATVQGVISKLKEQLRMEQELHRATAQRAQDQERLLAVILEESAQGLVVFDREGFLSQSNKLARDLLGPDTLVRRRYPDLLGPDSKLGKLVSACLEAGRATRDAEVEVRGPGGVPRPVAVSVLPLLTRDGEVSGALCLLNQEVKTDGSR